MTAISWIDLFGYIGSLLVFLSFCMTTMIPLRMIAISSTIVFILYAYLIKDYPLLILNILLLPINAYKYYEIVRLNRKVKEASYSDPSFVNLLPIMRKLVLKPGEVLFKEGDEADRLYYIQTGVLRIEGLDIETSAGNILGEVAVFTQEHKRTSTVVAKTDVIVYELTEEQFKRAYFRNPFLSFSLLHLITQRLVDNERRLTESLKQQTPIDTKRI